MLDPTSRIAVVLASAGRPVLLMDALRNCLSQTGASFRGVVSVPDEASLPEDQSVLDGWDVLSGTRGLAAQRNAGLDHLAGTVDIAFFFDDDAVLRSDYIANALAFLGQHPEVVGLTGHVLADGKITGEISVGSASSALASSWAKPLNGAWAQTRELYGANFAVRVTSAPDLRFDARLPLYSWLEDHDFARRLMPFGLLVRVDDCRLVHRAASSGGRTNHRRLGYSQVMNPVYLQRKGSFPLWLALQQLLRPVSKNLCYSIAGPSVQWRRERLRGNATAAVDVLMGRVVPERTTSIPDSPAPARSHVIDKQKPNEVKEESTPRASP